MSDLLAAVQPFVAATHPVRQLHRVRCLSISHRTARVVDRERFALSGAEQQAIYERFLAWRNEETAAGRVERAELVLISTCNRTEVYSVASDGPLAEADTDASDRLAALVRDAWVEAKAQPIGAWHRIADTLTGPTAVHHLFEVATGLQSVVLGEGQILTQLKDAYRAAHDADSAGVVMYHFFHGAFRAGRRARAETRIAEGNVSTASAGVALASRALGGSLAGRSVLLIGAGEISRLALHRLIDAGLDATSRIYLANRTVANLAPLVATAHQAGIESVTTVGLSAVAEVAPSCDVIVSAIHRDEPILAGEHWDAPTPTYVVDLGLPANIDPALGDHPSVTRVGVDDLSGVAGHPMRDAEIPKVRRIIEEEWQTVEDTREAVTRGIVDALFRRFALLNKGEATRTARRGLPETPDELEKYGQRLIRRVLKPIAERFGKVPAATSADLEALRQIVELFGLHPEDVEAPRERDQS